MAKLTAEQIEFLNKFQENGVLNENHGTRLVFDIIREKYLYIRGNNIKVLGEQATAKKLAHKDTPWVPVSELLNECPVVSYVFNPKNDKIEYEENGEKFINSFNVDDTLLFLKDIVKENEDKRIDLKNIDNFMEKHFPAFNILIRNLFTKEESRKWYLNRISSIINTREKIPTAALIYGEQGSGKGTLVEFLIKPIFGKKYTYVADNAALNSSFNSSFENKTFVVFNEIKTDLKGVVIEKIKALVSDTDLEINAKGVQQYTVANTFNCDFFTNHSKAIKIEASNRRFSVFETGPNLLNVIKEKGYSRSEYFNKLEEEKNEFALFVASLDYDIDYAYSVVQNNELEEIIEGTNTRIEQVSRMLKYAEFNKLRDKIEEAVEMLEMANRFYPKNYKDTLKLIEEDMKKGQLQIKFFPFIYNLLIDENESSSHKIGRAFAEIGEKKKGGGKTYRKLAKKYDPMQEVEKEEEKEEKTGEELAKKEDLDAMLAAYED
jgi:hypothetical protein